MTTATARGGLPLGYLTRGAPIVMYVIRTRTGTRTTTATARSLLVGSTLAAIIAPAAALAALGTLFAPVLTRALATMARRCLGNQAIGMGQTVAHVDTRFAVEFHEGKRDVRGLNALQDVTRHAVGAAVAALLLSPLLAAFGTCHIRKVHAEDLAALKAQNQLLARRVVLLNLSLTKWGVDQRLLLGCAALEILIGLELIAQAAHQTTANARDLSGVEGKILLLCHANGDRLELATKARAAQLLAAMGKTAHQACLVAHADLAHIDTHVKA